MALFLVTAPVGEPISLDEAKAHLRVDVDDDNGLIAALIQAAREYVETYTHRALLTQTWDLKIDAFPSCDIWLPFSPVTSVTSITYLDGAGASQTWSSALYRTDLPTGPQASMARITPAYVQSYPSTYGVTSAVAIRFVCGYGSDGSAVPGSILAAMKLLIGHWYAQREAVNVGNIVTEIPQTVVSLLTGFVSC